MAERDPQPTLPMYPPKSPVSATVESLLRQFADEVRELATRDLADVRRHIGYLSDELAKVRAEVRARPEPPADLAQFARDVLAVLGLHDSAGYVELQHRARTVAVMCENVLPENGNP